jgi:heme A synthase
MACVEDQDKKLENKKEACKTFIEQTKLLVTLASAFVVAPAAVVAVSKLRIDKWIIVAEVLFILSVLFGYIALGAIAGSQHKGEFNVYNENVKWAGRFEFCAYLLGLCFFMYWLVMHGNQLPATVQP